MTKKLIFTFSLLFLTLATGINATNGFQGIHALINRRVPWLNGKVEFSKTTFEKDGKEFFSVHSDGRRLHISASTESAAAMGLNHYLEHYCHRSMSHLGDNLAPISPLPRTKGVINLRADFPIRYALNYCTLNYTMSFYSWSDWEHELDWMALHGVNLMLATVGHEKVWQNTLRRLHFSEQQIQDFLPGPGFGAWWLMGNLEGWGGPVSQRYIDDASQMEKRILSRMKELGIHPVLQGFYGMVPRLLRERHPESVIKEGRWAGGFRRPDMINPETPLFHEVADIYYDELKKLYGNDITYLGGDLFHEGGNVGNANLARSGYAVQDAMQRNLPGSTWLIQGWGGNPHPLTLSELDKSHVIILDLFGESEQVWQDRKAYGNTPFVWNCVNTFGDQCGLFGKLQHIAGEIDRARNGPYAAYLCGVGIMPEGIANNPVVFDLVLSTAVSVSDAKTDTSDSDTSSRLDVAEWLKHYVAYRYGAFDLNIYRAWMIFLQTVYASIPEKERTPESIFCCRPGIDVTAASSWGIRQRYYDTDLFRHGVQLFLKAEDRFRQSETYRTDLIDFVRQVVTDRGDALYNRMNAAFKAADLPAAQIASREFLSLILKQDSLLANSRFFSLDTWLKQSQTFAATPEDRCMALRNAKQLITYWGPDDNPSTNLHDYSAREWSGMLRTLYYQRWNAFIDNELKRLEGHPVPYVLDFFSMEQEFAQSDELIETHPLPEASLSALIKELIQ